MPQPFELLPCLTLAELKERECTVAELQSALVNLIELYNKQMQLFAKELAEKQTRSWRATI